MPHLALYLLIFCLPWVVVTEAKTDMVMKRPNVLFMLIDDLGWSDIGCYGAKFHETPNIDRLAKQGVRFTDAYAASPV